ncbi:hypothetical protein MRX96_016828 [Rhipicephalus microplus]
MRNSGKFVSKYADLRQQWRPAFAGFSPCKHLTYRANKDKAQTAQTQNTYQFGTDLIRDEQAFTDEVQLFCGGTVPPHALTVRLLLHRLHRALNGQRSIRRLQATPPTLSLIIRVSGALTAIQTPDFRGTQTRRRRWTSSRGACLCLSQCAWFGSCEGDAASFPGAILWQTPRHGNAMCCGASF